jgi:type VI secretion system protein ImpH
VATEGRAPNSDLASAALPPALVNEPYRFSFFQAMRLLQHLVPGASAVGGYGNLDAEAVRIHVNQSSAFPASEIQALEFLPGRPPQMTVNFMGLTGPLGVLPIHYTEFVRDRMRARDTALADFLDIFNHRLISLFYLAWQKYRPAVTYEQGVEDSFCQRLYCLLGLGTPGLRRRREIPDESLLFNGGLLMMHTRPALVVEECLRGYFGVPVEVEQFVGTWQRIQPDGLCDLGQETESACLGVGAVVGDEIWSAQSAVRIRLGPLTLEQYRSFLPGGSAHGQLRAWVSYFAGLEFSVELQLVLRRQDVPACELESAESQSPRLGWTTWVKSAPFARDPSDLVFELH